LVLTANAVQAAPVGLALTISSAAALGGTAVATAATATQAIAMTTLQKAFLAATIAAVVATPLFVQNEALSKARAEQSTLLAEMSAIPLQAMSTSVIEDVEDRARRDREDLERLRRETASLRARIAELSTQAQRLVATNPSQKVTGTPIGETLRLAETRDVGQATPAALLQTHAWAVLHGDTNRLAQLMAFSPATDMPRVQRMFEALNKEATRGTDALLLDTPISEIRLLEEQPAGENDRWIVHELVNKDQETIRRVRIRVRPASIGWTLVIGIDGQIEQETVDEQPSNISRP
jgi:hypothetical protein